MAQDNTSPSQWPGVQSPVQDNTSPSQWAVVQLPRFFLLKGNNGRYLRSVMNSNIPSSVRTTNHSFVALDKRNATVFEAVNLSDGAMGIRSLFDNRFLTGNNAVLGAITGEINDVDEVERRSTARFWAVSQGRGTDARLIGLRIVHSVNNPQWCFTNLSDGRFMNGVHRLASRSTGFEVEEAVSQREIYGVRYFMNQAQLLDQEPLTSVTKDVKNWTNRTQTGVLNFSHTESESHSWNSTDSWKISASVTMSVRIPFVGGTEISTEAYYSGSYEWGEEQETAKQIESELKVEVPPMSMVEATMIVKKGKIRIPFAYSQRDSVFNGQSSTALFTDGLFKGVNTYVTFQTMKRSLA